MRISPILETVLICLGLMGAARAQAPANDAPSRTSNQADTDSAQASDSADATPEKPPAAFVFMTGHGLSYGNGKPSYNGLHAEDSLTLLFRQSPGKGKFSEEFDLSTNSKFKDVGATKKTKSGSPLAIIDDELGSTVKYRLAGLTLGADGGATYSAIIINKFQKIEKIKSKKTWRPNIGFSGSQNFAMDADSTLNWKFSAAYENYIGELRTFEVTSEATKSIGDFELSGSGSAYQQRDSSSLVRGASVGFGSDWDLDPHLISATAGLDWAFTSPQQTLYTLGAGYSYSPFDWLELGVALERQADLKNKSPFTLASASFTLTF